MKLRNLVSFSVLILIIGCSTDEGVSIIPSSPPTQTVSTELECELLAAYLTDRMGSNSPKSAYVRDKTWAVEILERGDGLLRGAETKSANAGVQAGEDTIASYKRNAGVSANMYCAYPHDSGISFDFRPPRGKEITKYTVSRAGLNNKGNEALMWIDETFVFQGRLAVFEDGPVLFRRKRDEWVVIQRWLQRMS